MEWQGRCCARARTRETSRPPRFRQGLLLGFPARPAGRTLRPGARSAILRAARAEPRAARARRTASLWLTRAAVRPSTMKVTPRDGIQAHRWAGLRIHQHALVLWRTTCACVVSVAEPYFEAGWTIAGVPHIPDRTPLGRRCPRDAVTWTEHIGAWFIAGRATPAAQRAATGAAAWSAPGPRISKAVGAASRCSIRSPGAA